MNSRRLACLDVNGSGDVDTSFISCAMATALATAMCTPRGGVPTSSKYTKTSSAACFRPHLPRRSVTGPRAANADDALMYGTAITDYVPSPMDTAALQSQGLVLLTVGVMTAYWWYVLVPGARVNLAVNKRTGKLKEYLVELKGDDGRKLERFFYQKWLAKVDPETRYLLRDEPDLFEEQKGQQQQGVTDRGDGGVSTAVKTKTQTVTLSDTQGVTRDADESLESIIRKAQNTPDFWSGDNPVLVALGLTIGLGAVAGAFHH